MAKRFGTTRALRDLRSGLADLANVEEELGHTDAAAALRAELKTVNNRLTALKRRVARAASPQ